MGEPTVTVTPWRTQWTAENPTGQYHDCLWEIAMEQAVLERMKTSKEDFPTAQQRVTPQEVQKHLDIVCDDNGFRRLGGGGSGRNPNIIHDNEKIKVRIDPGTGTQPAPPTGDRLAAATDNPIPNFENLPKPLQDAWRTAYNRNTASPYQLTMLANNGSFNALDEQGKLNVLAMYGDPNSGFATAEVNRILGMPVDAQSTQRMRLVGTSGFRKLSDGERRDLMSRYDSDPQFRKAVDKIIQQDNFTGKNDVEQAHALAILVRYSVLGSEGYPRDTTGRYASAPDRRSNILLKLYNDVLASGDFKLGEPGTSTQETGDQKKRIEDFADDAKKIK